MARGRNGKSGTDSGGLDKNGGANLGFEAKMFLAADKLRKNLEPSDYKHVALGLIFLKYISNAFEAKREALLANDRTSGRLNRAAQCACGRTCASVRIGQSDRMQMATKVGLVETL